MASSLLFYQQEKIGKLQKKLADFLVDSKGIEPSTSRMRTVRSSQLSYEPIIYLCEPLGNHRCRIPGSKGLELARSLSQLRCRPMEYGTIIPLPEGVVNIKLALMYSYMVYCSQQMINEVIRWAAGEWVLPKVTNTVKFMISL